MQIDLEHIYRTYRNSIYGIGFNYFRNETDASDIVQETFYKLSKSNKNFESEEHVRNWLIRIAINECKKISLSPWKKKTCNIDDYAEKLAFETPEQSELFTEVMKLKTKYRQVIALFNTYLDSAKILSPATNPFSTKLYLALASISRI